MIHEQLIHWHDIQEDPTDLPELGSWVHATVEYTDGDTSIALLIYGTPDGDELGWYDIYYHDEFGEQPFFMSGVIAWTDDIKPCKEVNYGHQ